MINKRKFNINSDKKILHKIGKKWVTVSTLFLGLIGGATVLAHGANASSTQVQPQVRPSNVDNQSALSKGAPSSQKQTNAKDNITVAATGLHNQLVNNTAKYTEPSSASVAPKSASSVASSSAIKPSSVNSSKDTNSNLGLGNPLENNHANQNSKPSRQLGVSRMNLQDSNNVTETIKFHDIYSDIDGVGGNVPSATPVSGAVNTKETIPSPTNTTLNGKSYTWAFVNSDGSYIGNSDSFNLQNDTKTNNTKTFDVAPVYKGLAYKYDKKNGYLEFIGGSINVKDTGDFLNVPQFGGDNYSNSNRTLQSVKFDNDVDTSNVTNMKNMFRMEWVLQSLDLGNNFDTSNVTNMRNMFSEDAELQSLDLDRKFNTSKVFYSSAWNDMSNMFMRHRMRLITIQSPNTKIRNDNGRSMFAHMYKEIMTPSGKPELDGNGKPYTLSTPNNFTQGNVGTFTVNRNPEPAHPVQKISYSDIYSNVDGMGDEVPQPTTNANAPIDNNKWSFVDNTGKIVSAPIKDNKGKIMVAPVYDGLTYKYDKKNGYLEFTGGKINVNYTWVFLNTPQFGGASYNNQTLKSVKFDSDVDISNVTNMNSMFSGDEALQSLTLPNSFDTSNVTNMRAMFFRNNLQSLTIQSPNTKFNQSVMLPTMYKETGQNDPSGKPYTLGTANDFSKGNVGTFTTVKNVEPVQKKVTDHINYYDMTDSDTTVGSESNISGVVGSETTITAPSGYYFTNSASQSQIALSSNSDVKINVAPISQQNSDNINVPVTPSGASATIDYNLSGTNEDVGSSSASGNWYEDSEGIASNSSNDTYDDITSANDSGVPNGYNLVNSNNDVQYNDGSTDVPVTPSGANATFNYVLSNGSIVGSNEEVSGNYYMDSLAGNTSTNITSANDPGLLNGYHLVNSSTAVSYDNNSENDKHVAHDVLVAPNSASATFDYVLSNGSAVSSRETVNGNYYTDSLAGNTNTNITPTNDPGLPSGYHLVQTDNVIKYDNSNHGILVAPNKASAVINIVDQHGKPLASAKSINGVFNENRNALTDESVPNGYSFVKASDNGSAINNANASSVPYTLGLKGQNITIYVKGNSVSRTATLHLIYNESNGKTDATCDVPITVNGNVGNTVTLADPFNYERDLYNDNNTKWTYTIPASAPSKLSDTFTYTAPTAGNLVVKYYDVTTGHQIGKGQTLGSFNIGQYNNKIAWVVHNKINISVSGNTADNNVDMLKLPKGYLWASDVTSAYGKKFNFKNEVIPVTLMKGKANNVGLTLHVGMMLAVAPSHHTNGNHKAPVTPNKPNHKVNPTPVKPMPKPQPKPVTPVKPAPKPSHHVTPAPVPNHNVQPKPNVQPSHKVTPTPVTPSGQPSNKQNNRPKVVPSDNTAKTITPNQNKQPKVISGKNNKKPSKAQNRPNKTMINKHTEHNHVDRNNGKKIAKPAVRTATKPYANHITNSVAPVKAVNPRVHVAPAKTTNNRGKLPQTGDRNIASMASILMLLTGIGLAGADLDRKHRLN